MNNLKTFLELLSKASSERRGVKPRYGRAEVYKTLLILAHEGPLGRLKIAEKIGLGEASVKTMLRRLKELELVDVDPVAGAYLTSKGEEVVKTLFEVMNPPITMDLYETARWPNSKILVLRRAASLLKKINVLDIRDELIRRGAKAALIIVVENRIPKLAGAEEFTSEEIKRIAKTAGASDNDLVLVAWSPEPSNSEKALIEVALDLLLKL